MNQYIEYRIYESVLILYVLLILYADVLLALFDV